MKKHRRSKKIIFAAILAVALLCALSVSAFAKEPDELLSDFSAVVPSRYKDIAEGPAEKISISSLVDFLSEELSGNTSSLSLFFLFTLGLCAVSAASRIYKSRLSSAVGFAISAVAMSALLEKTLSLFTSVTSSLAEANGFFTALIPVFCAVNSAGGGVGTASIQGAGMSLTASFCTAVISRLLPLIAAVVFSLEMLGTLGADSKMAKSAKNLYTKTLGAVTFIIAIILTFQSVVSSASDGIAIRTAKYSAQNLIPVVGSTVSSALSMLSGGLSYVKSMAGVGAAAVMIYIFLSPLVLLLLYRLALSVAAAIDGTLGGGGGIISPFLGIMDCMIASYSLCAVLYIFEILLFMRFGLVL